MTGPVGAAEPSPPSTSGTSGGRPVWLVAGALLVVAGLAAIWFGRGDDGPQRAETTITGPTRVDAAPSASVVLGDGTSTPDALPDYDATADDDPAVGRQIPAVSGSGLDGSAVAIGPDGTAKVIVFVAHWCPHCRREVPRLVEHLADQPMPADVELLTVSTSVKPGAEGYPPAEWLADAGWTAPVLADDDLESVADAFGLSAFPFFVVVDADGTVVERASGELSTERFDALVEAAQGR